MEKKISCIGSGNMGKALMKGAVSVAGAQNIGFSDIDTLLANAAAKSLGDPANAGNGVSAGKVYASNTEAVQEGEYVFLAVKPQVLKNVLEEIAPAVKERLRGKEKLTLVSMAAGWSIEKIQAALTVKSPVVRIMPNTPALISRGVIVMAPSVEVSAEAITGLERILSGAGLVDRLDEKYLDAVTGLSGSGPAYVYLFIEALADGGVRAGLPRDKALRYAAQTVLGSAAMVLETGKHPGELKDMVTSPGGTTIAGISALENGAFRAAAMNAVEAAWRRAGEL